MIIVYTLRITQKRSFNIHNKFIVVNIRGHYRSYFILQIGIARFFIQRLDFSFVFFDKLNNFAVIRECRCNCVIYISVVIAFVNRIVPVLINVFGDLIQTSLRRTDGIIKIRNGGFIGSRGFIASRKQANRQTHGNYRQQTIRQFDSEVFHVHSSLHSYI